MNKKLNFFEKLYCGWIHIYFLFLLWKEVVFETDSSQTFAFFDFLQYDYITIVEFTFWRGAKYNILLPEINLYKASGRPKPE